MLCLTGKYCPRLVSHSYDMVRGDCIVHAVQASQEGGLACAGGADDSYLLAGIYYGAQYGGSTTSILVNIPGEVTSIVTCIDGHQMALKGRAGPALGIAAWGSFIAGTFSIIGLMLVATPLANAALSFGPPEYFP
jgi:hypothetical protein